jgi:hypothetical protein
LSPEMPLPRLLSPDTGEDRARVAHIPPPAPTLPPPPH